MKLGRGGDSPGSECQSGVERGALMKTKKSVQCHTGHSLREKLIYAKFPPTTENKIVTALHLRVVQFLLVATIRITDEELYG